MLTTLIKKQICEIFRAYYYDAKKNRARSAAATAGYIIMFVVLMLFMCVIFGALSFMLCLPMSAAGLDWLFFAIMGAAAVIFGSFGSIFNTYSALYLAKDNDLLLSMPIPVRVIMLSRLMGVYLMGLMYSASAMLPASIIYLCLVSHTLWDVFCVLWLTLIVSLFVLIISCSLGFVVAKISVKLKNKTLITVAVSLIFVFGYYYLCSKMGDGISGIISNVEAIGTGVKGSAYPLYILGCAGAGDPLSLLIVTAVAAVLLALVWLLMSHSFIGIATASQKSSQKKYEGAKAKRRSARSALLAKEIGRLFSSANYLLNCGMGMILSPIFAVILCLRGGELVELLELVLPNSGGLVAVILSAVACALAAMNDMVVPSVSLEGKNLWILQSLPISAADVLTAKISVQVIFTSVPVLLLSVIGAVVCRLGVWESLMLIVLPQTFVILAALLGMVLGLKMPNLNWTSEIVVVKQSLGVLLAILIGYIYAGILIGGYFLLGVHIGGAPYMAALAAVTLAASFGVYAWIKRRGGKIFASL